MVGVVIECRLGNQLFQYAFIKGIADRLHTSFVINDNIERFIAADYFQLAGYNPRVNFLNRGWLKLKSGNLFTSQQSVGIQHYEEQTMRELADGAIYRGYFQSELFFGHIAHKINTYIRIRDKFRQQFEAIYRDMFARHRIIAVHVRRGDYLALNDWWQQNLGSSDLTLPAGYYFEALRQLGTDKNCKIIFVSDDMEFARATFGHLENSEFASNEMIIDFQVLMYADACVISNSSFSWWAAYLNQRKNKLVACPKYWLGFKIEKEYPEHIIPDGWIQVEVPVKI